MALCIAVPLGRPDAPRFVPRAGEPLRHVAAVVPSAAACAGSQRSVVVWPAPTRRVSDPSALAGGPQSEPPQALARWRPRLGDTGSGASRRTASPRRRCDDAFGSAARVLPAINAVVHEPYVPFVAVGGGI